MAALFQRPQAQVVGEDKSAKSQQATTDNNPIALPE